MTNSCQIPLIFPSRARRERSQAPYRQCCRIWRSLSMTPYVAETSPSDPATPPSPPLAEADVIIIDRPDRSSSIVAPNLRTIIR
jgi:hypothetical protein